MHIDFHWNFLPKCHKSIISIPHGSMLYVTINRAKSEGESRSQRGAINECCCELMRHSTRWEGGPYQLWCWSWGRWGRCFYRNRLTAGGRGIFRGRWGDSLHGRGDFSLWNRRFSFILFLYWRRNPKIIIKSERWVIFPCICPFLIQTFY